MDPLKNTNEDSELTAVATIDAVKKLESIDRNLELQIEQTEENASKMKPSLESVAKAMETLDFVLKTFQGPKGDKPEKGVDYMTDKDIEEIAKKAAQIVLDEIAKK